MNLHPIQGGVNLLVVASCYRKWDELRPTNGPLGSYADFTLPLPLFPLQRNATDECLFYQNHEENLFVSFASFKYYMNEHYDMFISIKRNGEVKQATSTLPGQDAIQFLALNADNWGFAKLDRILG